MALTASEKRERRAQLLGYVRKAKTMEDAKALALQDGIRAPTTAWIGAYADYIASQDKR